MSFIIKISNYLYWEITFVLIIAILLFIFVLKLLGIIFLLYIILIIIENFICSYKIELNNKELIFHYLIRKNKVIRLNQITKIEIRNVSSKTGTILYVIFNKEKDSFNITNYSNKNTEKLCCALKRQNIDIKFYGGDNQDPRKPRKINCDEILKDEHNFEH